MRPKLQEYVREAHPEVTFATLAEEVLQYKKTSQEGERERLDLLHEFGIELSAEDISKWRQRLGLGRVARDDIVDALACLATAKRIVNEVAVIRPSESQLDSTGLRMEIVA